MDKDQAVKYLRDCMKKSDCVDFEIADFIDQQAEQIEDMRKCANCINLKRHHLCSTTNEFIDILDYVCDYWKWDGGSE